MFKFQMEISILNKIALQEQNLHTFSIFWDLLLELRKFGLFEYKDTGILV